MFGLRSIGFALALAVGGCTAGEVADDHAETGSAALRAPIRGVLTNSGSFRGHYTVPVPPSLAGAATFSVSQVDWLVAGDVATVHYYLPAGLVGGVVEIEMSGVIGADLSSVVLAGEKGTASCHAVDWTVTCNETFANLGALPISMDVVRSVSATEYSGSPDDRAAVAAVFSSDPIGVLDFDMRFPTE